MTLDQIEQLLARGAAGEARTALEQLLAKTASNSEARKRLIDVTAALGDADASLQHARQFMATAPEDLDAMFYLAKAELSNRNTDAALALIQKLDATAANQSAAFQFLKGNVYAARRELALAEAAYLAATDREPAYAPAWDNLGFARQTLGDYVGAIAAWQRYLALDPGNKAVWLRVARVLHALGDLGAADAGYERVLALDANARDALREQADLLVEGGRFDRAKMALQRLLALGVNEDAENLLAHVLNEIGESAAAAAVLARPTASAPSLARRVSRALLLPQVYASAEALRDARAAYAKGLADLCAAEASGELAANDVFKLTQSNFLLAYQGENDLALQTQYADLLSRLMAKVRPDLVAPMGKRTRAGGRIKVLFVSSLFRECTVGHYFRSWITALDPAKFERKVIHTGWQLDRFAKELGTACDGFSLQRGNTLQVAEAIRAEAADIIIYPEVGMGAMYYLLANMRLAPVQCAAWGHPVTTGSAHIDYYFTCGEMEGANADEHYREKLLRLPGTGTAYSMPPVAAPYAREMLGLKPEHHVFICPQSLFKIHPDNDDIYVDIMAADPQSVILFFQGSWPAITQAFGARIGRAMEARSLPPRGQIKFLPRVDENGFRSLLAMADVVLDTLHWSGGNTSLDALSVGAPIVTLPGEFMRGRQTMAMLRAMDASELIASSREEYVQKAMAVASDRSENQRVRKKLLSNRVEVFDRGEAIDALARYLQDFYAS